MQFITWDAASRPTEADRTPHFAIAILGFATLGQDVNAAHAEAPTGSCMQLRNCVATDRLLIIGISANMNPEITLRAPDHLKVASKVLTTASLPGRFHWLPFHVFFLKNGRSCNAFHYPALKVQHSTPPLRHVLSRTSQAMGKKNLVHKSILLLRRSSWATAMYLEPQIAR